MCDQAGGEGIRVPACGDYLPIVLDVNHAAANRGEIVFDAGAIGGNDLQGIVFDGVGSRADIRPAVANRAIRPIKVIVKKHFRKQHRCAKEEHDPQHCFHDLLLLYIKFGDMG